MSHFKIQKLIKFNQNDRLITLPMKGPHSSELSFSTFALI